MNIGFWVLLAVLIVLGLLALKRREDPGPVVKRLLEQAAKLVPRMFCALVAAGFVAELLPKDEIARFLGAEAGVFALPAAAGIGLLVPAGPVIAFAIAAVFAKAGASTPALVTFITAWSIFAAHRMLIFELPLLGPSFMRMRLLSVAIVPFLAGLLAIVIGLVTSFGIATPHI